MLGFSQATEDVDLTKKNNILNSCSPSQHFYNKTVLLVNYILRNLLYCNIYRSCPNEHIRSISLILFDFVILFKPLDLLGPKTF